jgi:hypothetical protein
LKVNGHNLRRALLQVQLSSFRTMFTQLDVIKIMFNFLLTASFMI